MNLKSVLCTSKHQFFSGFEAEKGLRVIHACVVYTPFYGILLNLPQQGSHLQPFA